MVSNVNVYVLIALVCIVIAVLAVVVIMNKDSSSNQLTGGVVPSALLCPLIFYEPSRVPVPVSSDMEDQDYNANLALELCYFHELIYHLFCNDRILASSSEASLLNTFNYYMTSPFRVVKILYSVAPTPLSSQTQVSGFIGTLVRNNITYTFIIFRGTFTSAEWYNDAKIGLISPAWAPSSSGVRVHEGFNVMYTTAGMFPSLRDQVMSYINTNNINSNLIISGHSLGGALTGLFLCDLILQGKSVVDTTKTYLFATPYTGNYYFAEKIKSKTIINSKYKLYNLINNADPVPMTKLGPEYVRLAPQTFCFTDFSIVPGYSHAAQLYRNAIVRYKSSWNLCKSSQCGCCGFLCF
jgi:hypothetical protein